MAKLVILIVMLLPFIEARVSSDAIVFRDSNELVTSSEDDIELEEMQTDSENGGHFQGDIVLMPEQIKQAAEDKEGGLILRTGMLDESYRWPKEGNKVIVPYLVDDEYSSTHRNLIQRAMAVMEKSTCIQFRRQTNEDAYIYFKDGGACYSHLGRIGVPQIVSLEKDHCFLRGTIIHEIMHALGLEHMHSHTDRDNHISVLWDNVASDGLYNFEKVDPQAYNNFGTGYDLRSVMHYSSKAFSKNGQPTILTKDHRWNSKIGQRVGMSRGDVLRINNMYNCFVRRA